MTVPTFGISFERIDHEPKSVIGADLSVIGLVGAAPAADETAYPYDTPVLIYSDDAVMLNKLGPGGSLVRALTLINAQLGEFQRAARVVIVRVQGGDPVAIDTMLNRIVGNQANKTGIWALPEAGPLLGVMPRLIAVPGYTMQTDSGVTATNITAAGSGYATPPTITFSGGGGTGAAATAVLGTDADAGKVVGINITNPGTGYTGNPTIAFSGGGGTGAAATATVDLLANPVIAAIQPVLERMLAHMVASGPASTQTAFVNWRETINSDRIIPLETSAKVGVNSTVMDAAPAILGIMVRRDFENEGVPSKSAANQPVYGIVGPNRPIAFALTDGSTEGQQILANNGGIIVRGEAGVEAAISSGGFIYIGTDNAGDDETWRFYNVTRMRDYIHLSFLRALRVYLGRYNLDGNTIQAIYNTMWRFLRDLQGAGDILGYDVKIPVEGNSAEQLRTGRIQILFKAEEPPVLRHIHLQSARYLPALDAMIANLQTELDQAF